MLRLKQFFGVALIICVLLSGSGVSADETAAMSKGAYLAHAGDCQSCHIPGPDKQPYAGGLAVNSPFGAIYATNISPDRDTGIGDYTLEDFSRALRHGIAKDGHYLYPAMPYTSYTLLSDDDVQALYDYFMKEVKPVHFQPPETKLPFPFNQRWSLAAWNALFFKEGRFAPKTDADAAWNRGAYLAQSLAHCGACHTPRGIGYQEKATNDSSRHFLSGAVEDNWFAANLSGDPVSGLGRWSEADVAHFLKQGSGHGAIAFGNMTMVVEKSLQYLTDDDAAAIAHYVKSLPPGGQDSSYKPPKMPASFSMVMEHPGAGLYASSCASCHGEKGEGRLPRFPVLAGNAAISSANAMSVIRVILEGGKAPMLEGQMITAQMPAFSKFSDQQIADIVNFIRTQWGNAGELVTARDVASLRAGLKN